MNLTKYELVEITHTAEEKYDGITYDLEVEEDHSYNIEGIVVHNSVCTTRKQTGVGYPQLSATMEVADAVHGLGAHMISDGGCTCPGDIAKSFAAGADFVMLGGMLAGHDEGNGEIITEYYRSNEVHKIVTNTIDDPDIMIEKFVESPPIEKKFVQFYGMSSETANNKHFGGLKEYRSSEGRTVKVPYRGKVETTIQDILGGIRSTCTYIGAKSIKDMSKCATFIQVNNQLNRIFEGNTTGK